MPQLNWNVYDLIEVLTVVPTVEEFEVSHHFSLVVPPLTLALTVFQLESVVQVTFGTEGGKQPVLDFAMFVRDRVIRESTADAEWLEFRDVIVAPSRFSYTEMGDPFNRTRHPQRHRLLIQVAPQISLAWRRQ